MKYNDKHSGFTLIEVIIALAIFSIIMVSVMMIFYLASQMSTRVELNRFMQENVKNTFDIIAEDVRTGSLDGVRGFEAQCDTSHQSKSHILCLSSGLQNIEIALGEKTSETDWSLINDVSECQDIMSQCYVIKRENSSDWFPLTNSKSHITMLQFEFFNEAHPRISLRLGIRPAVMQGMASNLIEDQEIIVQTTLSERFIRQF